MSEFSLIDQLHQTIATLRSDVVLPSGDDCAILQPPTGMQLAVSTDTLIAGRHFPEDTSPHAIGFKSLAVNLSDLAAMGAKPAWASLALSLPEYDEAWIAGFAQGFNELAAQFGVQLVGGDTTRGPLSITVNIMGFLPQGKGLKRAGAEVGDDIYISGALGAAGYELSSKEAGERPNLDYPQPRIALGEALLAIASSAIDISDGLLSDLGHILKASAKGADISLSALPLAPSVLNADATSKDGGSAGNASSQGCDLVEQRRSSCRGAIFSDLEIDPLQLALAAGDEYELCFTAPAEQAEAIAALSAQLALPLTKIGVMTAGPDLKLYTEQGELYDLSFITSTGYNHFK